MLVQLLMHNAYFVGPENYRIAPMKPISTLSMKLEHSRDYPGLTCRSRPSIGLRTYCNHELLREERMAVHLLLHVLGRAF